MVLSIDIIRLKTAEVVQLKINVEVKARIRT
jgi:hypothetical protein